MSHVPIARRPYMPGYGVVAANEGRGLLPWTWAAERLAASRNYWLATVWPDGRPHVMPVWAVWRHEALWFSSSLTSRKARNLAADPRCVLTTEDPAQPVVVEGAARLVTDLDAIAAFARCVNTKYDVDYPVEFYNPAINGCYRMTPVWVFSLDDSNFTGSPTRWSWRE